MEKAALKLTLLLDKSLEIKGESAHPFAQGAGPKWEATSSLVMALVSQHMAPQIVTQAIKTQQRQKNIQIQPPASRHRVIKSQFRLCSRLLPSFLSSFFAQMRKMSAERGRGAVWHLVERGTGIFCPRDKAGGHVLGGTGLETTSGHLGLGFRLHPALFLWDLNYP